MKKKHFYSHLVETTELSLSLGDMDLSQEERVHLIALIESNLHHVVLDAILSELSDKDKTTFLHHLAKDKHDDIWDFLNSKAENISDKIKKAADELREELHQDIKEVKKGR